MKVLFAGRSPATEYQPLQADIFSGTSVGAVNAALMLCNPNESSLESALRLERVWLERVAQRPGTCGNGVFRLRGNPFPYLDASCLRQPALLASYFASDTLAVSGYAISRAANFFASSDQLDTRLVQSVNLASFIDSQPLHTLLTQVIDEAGIRQNPKRLSISTTNWVTGRVSNFTNADFRDHRGVLAVLASTSIPGVFPPVFIGADQFVDGGAAENTPLYPAIKLGATDLHVIDLSPPTQFIPISAQANTLETLLRVFTVLFATKVQEDIASIAWINAGIRALEHMRQTSQSSVSEGRDFVRAAGQILDHPERTFRIIRVHHYFPRVALGGDLDMLDFEVNSIKKMIEFGEDEALNHDCAANNCVL
jgi:predicted acylesterase/phospholipase RssA